MSNLEKVNGFYTSICNSGINTAWVNRMRGKKTSLGKIYRQGVIKNVGKINTPDVASQPKDFYPLFRKTESYLSKAPTLNNLSSDETDVVARSQKAIEEVSSVGDLREKVDLFGRGIKLTELDAMRLKLVFAREVEINRIIGDIVLFEKTSNALNDQFSEEAETGRFILKDGQTKKSVPVLLDFMDFSSIQYKLPENIANSDNNTKACVIRDYLVYLTTTYNQDTSLTPQFLEDLRIQIASQLESGGPLTLSIFLSLEKFANPFDTESSHVDIGEFQMATEIKEFISVIKRITGQKPSIVIMNESPNNQNITNASTSLYMAEFQNLLDLTGINDQVKIIPFDLNLFSNYLQTTNPNVLLQYGFDSNIFSYNQGTSLLPEWKANTIARQIHSYLEQAYHGIIGQQIKFVTDNLRFRRDFTISTSLPDELQKQLDGYIAKNFQAIKAEGQQTVSTELKRSVDPSVLSPSMSESLWQAILQNLPLAPPINDVAGKLRNYAAEQAKIQGLSFRALMRMRDVFSKLFGMSFMQYVVESNNISSVAPISLSITSNGNKLSWQLGRFSHTEIYIDGKEIGGVSPEHGAGVFVNGRIVSIHWKYIQKNPGYFRPIKTSINGCEINGYLYVANAALIDIDGTIKRPDEPIPDKVWETVVKTIQSGKNFGFSTGRGLESLNTDVYSEFQSYLRRQNIALSPEQQNLFFVSANHGALQMTGIYDQTIVYSQPMDIENVLRLERENKTLLGRLMSEYRKLFERSASPDQQPYDAYSYYLKSKLLQELIRSMPELGSLSLGQIVDKINQELSEVNSPVHVCQNSNGMDIVQKDVDKHLSLMTFQNGIERQQNRKIHSNSIVTVGDDPDANDSKLVNRPMGRSDITKLGPEKVAEYIDLVLGN